MKKQLIENLISQILTSSKCFLDCSRAHDAREAHILCSEQGREGDAKPQGSDHDVATFCPVRELCNMSGTTEEVPSGCREAIAIGEPNLVCRFACLVDPLESLNEKETPGYWDKNPSSPSMIHAEWGKFLHAMATNNFDLNPHKVFSDAVLGHQQDLSYFFHTNESTSSLRVPAFRLPTCISESAFGLHMHDVNRGAHNPHVLNGPPMKNKLHWADFEFTCGDWKASGTNQFLNDLRVGPKSREFRDKELAWWYTILDDRLVANHLSPATHFLTYCEAGIEWPSKVGALLSPDGQKRCDMFRDEIKDMQEAEASFWLCYGPTARKAMNYDGSIQICEEFEHRLPMHSYWPKYRDNVHKWEKDRKKNKNLPYPYRVSFFSSL